MQRHKQAAAALLATLFVMAGCGGGSAGDASAPAAPDAGAPPANGAPPPATGGSPPPANAAGGMPADAGASVSAFLTFLKGLAADDASEPINVDQFTPPVDDAAETPG